MSEHRVRVAPIPGWVDHERLLGPPGPGATWELAWTDDGSREAHATMPARLAADLAARLRGVGIDGRALVCEVEPPLGRALIRAARTEDARRRRDTTPGFERPGVRFDEQGRWSLTPERLAMRIASTAAHAPIVDAGCGLGGNAIAFARAGCRVVAIESDADRLALARHNAGIYQVADRIRFVRGDARELAIEHASPEAILFIDPPWGTDWNKQRCGLGDLPLLGDLLEAAGSRYAAVWAKVPPSFATAELARAVPEAMFGEAEGDHRRIKLVLLRLVGSHNSSTAQP